MPANTVYVGRPTTWGNPFPDVRGFEDMCRGMYRLHPLAFLEWLLPLKGRNLACWCATDAPCHADVLLFLADATVAQLTRWAAGESYATIASTT